MGGIRGFTFTHHGPLKSSYDFIPCVVGVAAVVVLTADDEGVERRIGTVWVTTASPNIGFFKLS